MGVALAGCASGGNPTTDAERVTVTESVTPTASATTPSSDVKGRRFDVGTVSGVKEVDGELVLQLDRWTVKGLPDAQLAKDGITVTPHTGDRFENQNDDKLRTVPVAPGATVVVNRCVKNGDQLGLTSTPQDAAGWLDDPNSKAVLLLTYDSAGRVVRMDTDPRC
ncbi:MAG TPA: hypothetical protein VFL94_01080 [Actinomycetales bacterium]|nr:hypothetical protein [Actinomycetales bacterium]